MKQLIAKTEKKQFYSRNRKPDVFQSTAIGNKKSFTLYIGRRKSDVMFRIYDKDLETAKQKHCAVEEIGSWKRLEIELKRQVAHSMAKVIAFDERSLEELIRGVVKDELTFYTDDTWEKVWRPWERYLGNIQPLHLSRVYEVTGLTNTQDWLIHGGGLAGIKAFRFSRI
ncbi:replication initiation factor domain-containing protein [Enterococcus rivorum]|uniref:replication initiation factor domain-containing protein n=1 Tax=Enterococcus rivorum TaxID=762845 RepID=UPI00362EAF1A